MHAHHTLPTRTNLAQSNREVFGARRAFAIELERLERRGVTGERAFGTAALHVFGRWVR